MKIPNMKKEIHCNGKDTVNVNIFDKKIEYRKIAEGGQRIHASNSEKESNRNIGLILNKSIKDFNEENKDIKEIHSDLIGSKTMGQFRTIFYYSKSIIRLCCIKEF